MAVIRIVHRDFPAQRESASVGKKPGGVPPQHETDRESMKDKIEHSELWALYRSGDRSAYEALVECYLPMVKVTVGRMSVNVPAFVDREDLYSAGCMGLLSAIERYDPQREAKFTTYALTRIRGSIIDELRHHDVLGRVTRERVTRIREAERELQNQGKELGDSEVAAAAGLTLDEYWDAEIGEQATRMVRLSESSDDDNTTFADILANRKKSNEPGHEMEMAEIIELIYSMLDEKEQLLVVLYYREELTLKEIGQVMKVSESRVCQLHTAMANKIRARLEKKGIYL